MSKFYFASDGSYGDASGLEVHDISDWTDAMWEEIESATDNSRPSLSDHFAKGEHEFNPEFENRCDECSLTQEQLKN